MKNPPIAIIRTVPTLTQPGQSKRSFERSCAWLDSGEIPAIYYALPTQPKQLVLHLYIASGGLVIARFVLMGYESGNSRRCWDGKDRAPGCWAVVTGPVSRPPREVPMRGFRGFRYLEEPLW
jgi:hypothetical protein